MLCVRQLRPVVLKHDIYRPVGEAVEFRLIYDGPLYAASRNDTRSQHKHDIRRIFHRQLQKLWRATPNLKDWVKYELGPDTGQQISILELTADSYRLGNYRLAPLSTKQLELGCSLEFLFLRYDQPGQTLLQSGDIDNRIKTIFDALRMPKVGEYCGEPLEGEDPFFCLLEDDSMITHLSVTTDLLLEPSRSVEDVLLVITVKLWPLSMTLLNMGFGVR
jgi:hypothetical protein